ncbi:MAG TPA: NAD(P)H-dependent oxidoreductase [Candidatus Blautia avistercoris]|nr:NAD(P)H-dependent oxidoreductase [Candidatus Blautia avistercoris]
MRKLIGIGMIVILLAALTACKEEESSGKESFAAPSVTPQTSEQDSAASQSLAQGKVLVAYFSWADNAVLDEDVDAVASPSVVSPGNVQELAGWVQEETGGDLFSIRVTEPYPSDWDACLDRANQERGENARPKLTEQVENLEDYDIVFLGFPNWWYGAPMAVLSFLEENDLSGKQIYLFCSHGTGGLANSVEDIKGVVPDGKFSDNIFDCYEEDASGSQQAIQDWVKALQVPGLS